LVGRERIEGTMAAPPNSRLQSMLRAAVQSVQWTYSLFWQLCPQQGYASSNHSFINPFPI